MIAVETGTKEEVVPADPASPASTQEVRQQPGQVWFPNTAYKTAQAIQVYTYIYLDTVLKGGRAFD